LQLDSPALESFRNWFMGTWLGTRSAARTFQRLLTYQLPKLRFDGRENPRVDC
jgi:hypothetical protein